MRARGWSALAVLSLMVLGSGTASAEPKPKPVDIKPIRDKLVVLQDADGGTYVVLPGRDGRVFYGAKGKAKNVYEQVVIGRSSDASAGSWDVSLWAPRVPNVQPGSVGRKADGTHFRYCGGDNTTTLTELIGDKAKAVLDKSAFFTSAMIRRPHLLARDDGGVYYYVDVIRNEYGTWVKSLADTPAHAEVGGRLQRVAGEDAEAAAVRRQRRLEGRSPW